MTSCNIVKIESYYGRLSNNICQLYNAVLVALTHNYDIIEFPQHIMFRGTSIQISKRNKSANCNYITDTSNFFKIPSRLAVDVSEADINAANKYMQKVFIYGDISVSATDDLVIHIRSGDIFKTNPHEEYMQPPLEYYTQIIDKIKPQRIIIITEDRLNPCTNKLIELYSNASLLITDIDTTIKKILSAKTVVCGVGTFVQVLLYFSKNLQKLYSAHKFDTKFLRNKNATVDVYDLADYKNQMGNKWKNTPEQCALMLTYKRQT